MHEEAFKREKEMERGIFSYCLVFFESISNMRRKKNIVQPLQMASNITPVQLIHNGFYQVAEIFLR